MRETLRHREAFEDYHAMGKGRSLVALAVSLGVSEKTTKRWSRAFEWRQRILVRDEEIAQGVAEKVKADAVATKLMYRRLLRAAMEPYERKIAAKEAGVESIAEMERIIKLDLLLMGEPTEHVRGEVTAGDDLFDRIDKYAGIFARRGHGQSAVDGDGAGESMDPERPDA